VVAFDVLIERVRAGGDERGADERVQHEQRIDAIGREEKTGRGGDEHHQHDARLRELQVVARERTERGLRCVENRAAHAVTSTSAERVDVLRHASVRAESVRMRDSASVDAPSITCRLVMCGCLPLQMT
jgi:hypothetical protein